MATINVPKGKKLIIMKDNELVVPFDIPVVIDDDITISLSSSFSPLFGGGDTKALNFIGAALGVATEGRIELSGQFKQLGYQQWSGTDPLAFTTTISFYMGATSLNNAEEEVYVPVMALAGLALPNERAGGVLVSPGPPPTAAIEQLPGKYKTRVVSIQIGQLLYLSSVIVKRAEPMFSKETDENGFPIWGKITLDINSLFSASVQMLQQRIGFEE